MPSDPRPLFIYGALCAMPLLAWTMTGEATKIDQVRPLLRRAVVHGYKRCPLYGRDYPAAVPYANSSVDGYLLTPESTSQRRKLDDFEGEAYKIVQVAVTLDDGDGQSSGNIIEADMYVWDQNIETVDRGGRWDLDIFIEDRLEDRLDLFEGMELVGGGTDD
ncbi:hypothetical protein B0H63DRAFT_99321 [Podospora didyma]|uniref:Putative gamma-glutamylcyclotransferase n=1 Tax=Podospora didyma TaxID=330526 RepID=A0AAE0NXI8_9PEZI|nr:hypothetical protein B0H63DRAFT_99321 [Podospora didyma]